MNCVMMRMLMTTVAENPWKNMAESSQRRIDSETGILHFPVNKLRISVSEFLSIPSLEIWINMNFMQKEIDFA